MRPFLASITMLLVIYAAFACAQRDTAQEPAEEVLGFYRQFSPYTDPGEHAHLYDGLPESIDDVCELIKKQLIHPLELGELRNRVPEERHYEDTVYVTVEAMLGGLLEHDSRGLIPERKPQDRIFVACVHHAMLFASIMKHRGIPARLRCGFAPYIGEAVGRRDLHPGHVICEVWDAGKRRWILVDPDRRMVDIPRGRFEFACDVWRKRRADRIDSGMYRTYRAGGDYALAHMLCLDLRCVLNNEVSYWLDPPVADDPDVVIDGIEQDRLEILDRLADLLGRPDGSLDELARLLDEHEYLQ
jgi:hypothetical protein